MKRILFIFFVFFMFALNVYADNASCFLENTSNKTNLVPGDEFEINVGVNSLADSTYLNEIYFYVVYDQLVYEYVKQNNEVAKNLSQWENFESRDFDGFEYEASSVNTYANILIHTSTSDPTKYYGSNYEKNIIASIKFKVKNKAVSKQAKILILPYEEDFGDNYESASYYKFYSESKSDVKDSNGNIVVLGGDEYSSYPCVDEANTKFSANIVNNKEDAELKSIKLTYYVDNNLVEKTIDKIVDDTINEHIPSNATNINIEATCEGTNCTTKKHEMDSDSESLYMLLVVETDTSSKEYYLYINKDSDISTVTTTGIDENTSSSIETENIISNKSKKDNTVPIIVSGVILVLFISIMVMLFIKSSKDKSNKYRRIPQGANDNLDLSNDDDKVNKSDEEKGNNAFLNNINLSETSNSILEKEKEEEENEKISEDSVKSDKTDE